jgi:hypothetical protein
LKPSAEHNPYTRGGMAEELVDEVVWKGMKFTRMHLSSLPENVYVYISNDIEQKPTEAEIIQKMHHDLIGHKLVDDLLVHLPGVQQTPFIYVYIPDKDFPRLMTTPSGFTPTRAAPRRFPDGSIYTAQMRKANYLPARELPPYSEWQERDYIIATNVVHELFHCIKSVNQKTFHLATEEGLMELIPRLVLGFQHFMPESSKFLVSLSETGSTEWIDNKPPTKLHTIAELEESFFRYPLNPQRHIHVNPAYGSAYLFWVGIFKELQAKLIGKDKKYESDTETLNYLIKELSTPETPDAVIEKLAALVSTKERKITPEDLQNGYEFQKKGQEWVRSLLEKSNTHAAREQKRRENLGERETGIS